MFISDSKDLNMAAHIDFDTFARLSFSIMNGNNKFHDAPYLQVLAAVLQNVCSIPGRNQIINLPPRFLNSFVSTNGSRVLPNQPAITDFIQLGDA
ncbi:hypothetical protein ACFONL_22660 [Camelimonas fluminis]|uniref:Uncharacterized protein n=1 Tax=Camelimonas fluminis TaxID=1576911 RepID=A0ABV7UNT9_9HYPH|nr:hypothetical protein [Camelimonas fluminis]